MLNHLSKSNFMKTILCEILPYRKLRNLTLIDKDHPNIFPDRQMASAVGLLVRSDSLATAFH